MKPANGVLWPKQKFRDLHELEDTVTRFREISAGKSQAIQFGETGDRQPASVVQTTDVVSGESICFCGCMGDYSKLLIKLLGPPCTMPTISLSMGLSEPRGVPVSLTNKRMY